MSNYLVPRTWPDAEPEELYLGPGKPWRCERCGETLATIDQAGGSAVLERRIALIDSGVLVECPACHHLNPWMPKKKP